MGVVSRMAVTRYLALAFIFVATATAQDDFWPPFQEEWRCLGEDDGKLYDWVDDSPAWVEETHHLITYVDNPEGQAAIDFDCPVIDPTDTATWFHKELTTILYHVTVMPTTDVLRKTMEKYGLAFTSANLTIWFTILTPNLVSITIKHLLELALPRVLDQLKVPQLNQHLNLLPNPHLNPLQQPRNQPQLPQLWNQLQLQQPWNQRL